MNYRTSAKKISSFLKISLIAAFTFLLINDTVFANGNNENLNLNNFGEIMGKIIDKETGEAIGFAAVVAESKGFTKSAITDEMGLYTLKPLPPGTYTVKVAMLGYQLKIYENVTVGIDQTLFLDIELQSAYTDLPIFTVIDYRDKIPLFDPSRPTSFGFESKDLVDLPTKNVKDAISTGAGVFQSEDGNLQFRGARQGSIVYMVDGIKMRNINVPMNGVSQMEVYTGGIPAKYGDTTGGVIVVETKSYFSD